MVDNGRAQRRPGALPLAGMLIVSVFTVVALAAPLISPYDPAAIDPVRRLEGISSEHLLGTDNLGRDLFSRMAHGARWSIGSVVVVTAVVVFLGVIVGTTAGFKGGRVDGLLMRVVDILLAVPSLLLALAIAGTLGAGLGSVMAGLASVGWAAYARVVRGMVLELRERDFVSAGRALGASDSYIVVRHIIPNVLPAIGVLATIEMGELILAVAGFGFLGLGAQPPVPEWGAMINDARPYFTDAPLLVVVPGMAIGLLVAGFNLLGDSLRGGRGGRSAG